MRSGWVADMGVEHVAMWLLLGLQRVLKFPLSFQKIFGNFEREVELGNFLSFCHNFKAALTRAVVRG